MSAETNLDQDPCAINTPARKWAFLWAFAAIIFGACLAYRLSIIDAGLYAKKGRMLDYDAYRENREAFTAIPSEGVDSRRYPLSEDPSGSN